MTLNSNRFYTVASAEFGLSTENITLNTLAQAVKEKNCAEIWYAMDDRLDEVLDLKVGESMYFQPNRDDKKSKGIIFRVK